MFKTTKLNGLLLGSIGSIYIYLKQGPTSQYPVSKGFMLHTCKHIARPYHSTTIKALNPLFSRMQVIDGLQKPKSGKTFDQ